MPEAIAKSMAEAADWILEDAARSVHLAPVTSEKAGAKDKES
jgi:hypothetical protein